MAFLRREEEAGRPKQLKKRLRESRANELGAFMSGIQLFATYHNPDVFIPSARSLIPVQAGAAFANTHFKGMKTDDAGDNISIKNPSYCELTTQYWAWKNVDASHYGFMHYRRLFNFSKTIYPIHHEPFIFGEVVFDKMSRSSLKEIGFFDDNIQEVVKSCDFIAPVATQSPNGLSVYEQYRSSEGHHIEDLDLAMDIIEKKYPRIWPSACSYLNQAIMYVCNMFVMRKELFFDYSAFLFDVLNEHESERRVSDDSTIGRRVSGYLGERICGMYIKYLYEMGYDGRELQRVFFRDVRPSRMKRALSAIKG